MLSSFDDVSGMLLGLYVKTEAPALVRFSYATDGDAFGFGGVTVVELLEDEGDSVLTEEFAI